MSFIGSVSSPSGVGSLKPEVVYQPLSAKIQGSVRTVEFLTSGNVELWTVCISWNEFSSVPGFDLPFIDAWIQCLDSSGRMLTHLPMRLDLATHGNDVFFEYIQTHLPEGTGKVTVTCSYFDIDVAVKTRVRFL